MQLLQRSSIAEVFLRHSPCLLQRKATLATKQEHLRTLLDDKLADVRWASARQHFNRLSHFHPVSHRAPKRLAHVCEHRHSPDARILSCSHHAFGQSDAILRVREQSSTPKLNVEHQRPSTLGNFFRHDGRSNQGQALCGAGHISQCVNLLVNGTNRGGCSKDGNTNTFELCQHLIEIEVRPHSRDCFKFVQCAACVPKTPAAHHRNYQAKG
mmetsp:Transcript_28773/g.58965  ORF Transcript_28773/g.58965 Transcript_28773/m.58965 type:complete len:212 (-) Transcript_28773:599-1234(-)